ncbi:hypothetical protein B9Z55_004019 [Caenorhabditis nigoni]|uniref:ATPase AAA-type core domain-containing protein n=1 Tax=Caenorhabditis nigoni TaxID=1611254 RepID=A0A2G5UUL8_9PELO|nr:hypothetical protein B9Z55_004019 [Caenorhabditis nigoni]
MNSPPATTQFYSTHLTKEKLLNVIITLSKQFKKLNRGENAPKTRMVTKLAVGTRRDLIFYMYINLINMYKTADRMVSIEGSQTNLKCLLVATKFLSSFFDTVFTKLPQQQIEDGFNEFFISHNLTECDVSLSATWRIISNAAISHHEHLLEVKKSCQEQKAFRESFLKTQTDFDIDFEDHEADQETQLLSIEDAVLIIQKLERKYQAISRRNYVRFVRERAAELHGQKVEIDATQAAIRIQAPGDLETALELLKTDFFLATSELPDPSKIPKLPTQNNPDTVYRDACFRGIVSPISQIELSELISQRELCKIENRIFLFDLRTFLTLTICIPLSLATWHKPKDAKVGCRWLLMSGAPDSGKTTWARAIARASHITHVHISKNVVNMGKRRIYTVIKKLAKNERRILISVDRIDVLKKDPKNKGYTHRQMLLRTFLSDISNIKSATIIGMTKLPLEDLDSYILDLFPLHTVLSIPTDATRYELAVDCLSRNLELDRLPKFPKRIFDIEKQTNGASKGKTAKFVTNRWSAANNKTNLS